MAYKCTAGSVTKATPTTDKHTDERKHSTGIPQQAPWNRGGHGREGKNQPKPIALRANYWCLIYQPEQGTDMRVNSPDTIQVRLGMSMPGTYATLIVLCCANRFWSNS